MLLAKTEACSNAALEGDPAGQSMWWCLGTAGRALAGRSRYLAGDASVVPGVAAQVLTTQQQLLLQLLLQPLGGPVHDVPLLGELQHRVNGDVPQLPGTARPASWKGQPASWLAAWLVKPVYAKSLVQIGEPG